MVSTMEASALGMLKRKRFGSPTQDVPRIVASKAYEASPRVKTARTCGTTLCDLGEDLLLRILITAAPPPRELCRYARVNKLWRRTCANSQLWQNLTIGYGNMAEGIENIALHCSSLQVLHIDDPRCELHFLHPIIMACTSSLRHVIIECDKDRTSRNEASICSILWIISLYCKGVESIKLATASRGGSFGILESKAMWYLTSGFRSIKEFACMCRNSVTKQAIYLMVIAWRELSILRMHCGGLVMEDLMSLRKCYSLRVLEIVGGGAGLIQKQPFGAVMHLGLEEIMVQEFCCQGEDIQILANLCPQLKKVHIRFFSCQWETPADRRGRLGGLKKMQLSMAKRDIHVEVVV